MQADAAGANELADAVGADELLEGLDLVGSADELEGDGAAAVDVIEAPIAVEA